MLIGTLILPLFVLRYIAMTYWIFRGKAHESAAYHKWFRHCAGATLPGLITPHPIRNNGMRPRTGRSKARGTSGTRSGK